MTLHTQISKNEYNTYVPVDTRAQVKILVKII